MISEESLLKQCEHCCRRVLYLTGFRRTTVNKILKVAEAMSEHNNSNLDVQYYEEHITEWFYCSEECKDAHTKQTEAWTPDKQRASLSIFDDKTLDAWKKRHSL